MPSSIRYSTISDLLAERVPEVSGEYKRLLDSWGDETPGPHVVYGEILNPYLLSILRSEDTKENSEILRRIFQLLEDLLEQGDEAAQEVPVVTVLERLNGSNDVLAKARQYMQPLTLDYSRRVEEA